MNLCKQLNRKVLILQLALYTALTTGQSFSEVSASAETPEFSNRSGSYLNSCMKTIPRTSGFCLLSSRAPKPDNLWLIRSKDLSIRHESILDKPVTPNLFLPLRPGDYLLYSKDGFDNGGHEYNLSVDSGKVTTLKTSTFVARNTEIAIRHFQPSRGTNNSRCAIRKITSPTVMDVLPGDYIAYTGDLNKLNYPCPTSGAAINALSGQVQSVGARSTEIQSIPQSEIYSHPNGKSSLTSISQFREDIQKLGILSKWDSIRGITNPYPRDYSALVLFGLATRTYVIPFILNRNQSVCGRSIAKAGLKSLPLLTKCRFSKGQLLEYKVQAGGSYFTINNRHGVPAIEGNNINNSVLVTMYPR